MLYFVLTVVVVTVVFVTVVVVAVVAVVAVVVVAVAVSVVVAVTLVVDWKLNVFAVLLQLPLLLLLVLSCFKFVVCVY